MTPAGKFDGIETIALFPASAGKAPQRSSARAGEAAAKPIRPLGYAPCPRCTKAKLAVVPTGVHVVWKPHTLTTWGGTPLPCAASGVALCTLPAKLEPGASPLGCVH